MNPDSCHETAASAMASVKAGSNDDQNDNQNSSIKSLACSVPLMAEDFSKASALSAAP
jgi:hypothetical protein